MCVRVLPEGLSSMQSGYLDTDTLIVIGKACTMKFIIVVHISRYADGHLVCKWYIILWHENRASHKLYTSEKIIFHLTSLALLSMS